LFLIGRLLFEEQDLPALSANDACQTDEAGAEQPGRGGHRYYRYADFRNQDTVLRYLDTELAEIIRFA
jgi:hypothetical protein